MSSPTDTSNFDVDDNDIRVSDAQPPSHNPAFAGLHLPFVGFTFTQGSNLSDLGWYFHLYSLYFHLYFPIGVFGGKSVGAAGFKYHENRESHIFARARAAAAARAVLRRLEGLIPARKLPLMHYVHHTVVQCSILQL